MNRASNVERMRKRARLFRAAKEVCDEVQSSLHPGQVFDDIADTEVIEVTVAFLRELHHAIADYEIGI